MSKNGIVSKVTYGVIMLIIIGAAGAFLAIQDNTHAAEVNKTDIKRVDSSVRDLIIEQKDFQEKTTKSLHAIDKDVTYIRAKLEGD